MTSKIKPTNLCYRNKRIFYILAVVMTTLLGLASRKYSQLLLLFVAQNSGDILWAMMVYFGFRFLLVSKSLHTAVLFSFAFSFGIECSQLYQDNWINQIRGTSLGALILGKGFLFVDLIRYTVGIMIGAILDWVILMLMQRRYQARVSKF